MRCQEGAFALLLTLAIAALPAPLTGQGFSLGTTAPVRTLDQERLFADSLFGQRVVEDVERASRELAEENQRIEDELAAEEERLAERRADLPPEEFRTLADEFNSRVERIRREQEAKARAITRMRDAERQEFFEAALPVLTRLLQDSGAVAILDSRAIFIAADRIDMTEQAIDRLDETLGVGDRVTPESFLPEQPPPPQGGDEPTGSGTDMLPSGQELDLPAPAE